MNTSNIHVVVCGGRDYQDVARVYAVLDDVHARMVIVGLAEGGAQGADSLARRWAKDRGIPTTTYPADWAKNGRMAGPIRNAAMLRAFEPDLVVAFPGGRGTADLVRRARERKITTLLHVR